jgi:hypothetical protein
MADVARLERVVTTILGGEEPGTHAPQLEVSAAPTGLSIPVSLPGETRPLWLNVTPAIRNRLIGPMLAR